MNKAHIRKQLEDITLPDYSVKEQVLQQIQIRKHQRKVHKQICAAVVLLIVIIGAAQFQQLAAAAEKAYRSIQLSLHNETLTIATPLHTIPIEVDGLTWVGKQPNRVGDKSYPDITAAEEELQIKLLPNTMSRSTASGVGFVYFEKHHMAQLIRNDIFIGDLKNFRETLAENGDVHRSYRTDHDSVYKSPVSMKVAFFTGSGAAYEMDNLETYHYEEKYTSPVNGITAYLLSDTFQASTKTHTLLLNAAGRMNGRLTVFVHDHLLYILYGNIPSAEMKTIIDAFVVAQQSVP